MNGYKKRIDGKEIVIGITALPNRKRLYLYWQDGYIVYPCATFSNDENAYMFMDVLADFIGADRFKWFGREEQGK